MNTNIGRLPHTVEVAIFRVIQEALQNVQRHANASQVEVVVAEKEGSFQFVVADNGSGMASDRVDLSKKNLGLARMVDYVDLLGGGLQIFSEPEQGTTVILSVPYHGL
jgi:two-component system sensor histidine kinase DegS